MAKNVENEVMVIGSYRITSKELYNKTNQIIKLTDQIKSNYYKIGKLLLEIKKSELVKNSELNFNDYCEEILGISMSTAYRIMQVAEKIYLPYLEEQKRIESGKQVGMQVDLTKYSDVALSRLLTVGDYDEIKQFVQEYDITPQMSTREINEILAKRKKEMEMEEVVEKTTEEDNRFYEESNDIEDEEEEVNVHEETKIGSVDEEEMMSDFEFYLRSVLRRLGDYTTTEEIILLREEAEWLLETYFKE